MRAHVRPPRFNGQGLPPPSAEPHRPPQQQQQPQQQPQLQRAQQGHHEDVRILMRVDPGQEFVKVVLLGGRAVGAVLIGDTDLEETLENLILNRLDLSRYGEDLLREDVDLEDFFD